MTKAFSSVTIVKEMQDLTVLKYHEDSFKSKLLRYPVYGQTNRKMHNTASFTQVKIVTE